MSASLLHETEKNLWTVERPLGVMGIRLGRRMTILRLEDGELIVHSPFPMEKRLVEEIRGKGSILAFVEATTLHDTFTEAVRKQFPRTPYLVPPAFPSASRLGLEELPEMTPPEWQADLKLFRIGGMPDVNETVVLHRPGRTLIVADLVFNVRTRHWWTSLALNISARHGCVAASRFFKLMIRDRRAFRSSLQKVLEWDFEKLIPAHGEIVECDARQKLAAAWGAG